MIGLMEGVGVGGENVRGRGQGAMIGLMEGVGVGGENVRGRGEGEGREGVEGMKSLRGQNERKGGGPRG